MLLNQWSSYSLRDFIPLEIEVYVNLFARINQNLWPWTVCLTVLGLLIIFLTAKHYSRLVYIILGSSWCLCAYVFHYQMLNELHWVGYVLAVFFVFQGCLLLVFGIFTKPHFQAKQFKCNSKILIMLTAIIVCLCMPLFDNRSWQSVEVFGVAPNPTCWLTIGALITLKDKGYRYLIIFPILWVLLSFAVVYATYEKF